MQDAPSAKELIEAVRAFLEEKAMPELKGHTAFHARVAVNALAIVQREMEIGPRARDEERARLRILLKHDGSIEDLNVEFGAKIRSGEMGFDTPGLREHLWLTTLDKVAIDQPKYSGYLTALNRESD